MGNAKIAKPSNFTAIVVLAQILAAACMLAALAVAPRSAAALPTYSQRENRPCEYCHINPSGGGEQNAVGKEYEDNGHKLKTK